MAAAVEVTYKYTSQQKQSGKWVVQIPLSDGSLLGDRAKYSTSAVSGLAPLGCNSAAHVEVRFDSTSPESQTPFCLCFQEAARAADALLVARKPSGELKHDVFDAEASRAGPVLRPLNFPLEQAEALVRLDREGICDIGEQVRVAVGPVNHAGSAAGEAHVQLSAASRMRMTARPVSLLFST